MDRYCKQLGLPIYVVGKNNQFPPRCTVFGKAKGDQQAGHINVRLPAEFGSMPPLTAPISLFDVQQMVEKKLGDREYLLVVWSENRDQAWKLPKTNLQLPGRIEIHALVYDGCYSGPTIYNEKRIYNTAFFKRLPMQLIQGIEYSNNVYVRKLKDRRKVKSIRIKAFSNNWEEVRYQENDLYYSNDASDDNNKFLWQVKVLKNQQWGIFPLNGEANRTKISTHDMNGNLLYRDGKTIHVERSSNLRRWWWRQVEKPPLDEFTTPAPYGMDLRKPKFPIPKSKTSETWYEKVDWSRSNAEEYLKTVVSLSYPTIQQRIKNGANPVMCLGAAGTFLLEEQYVFRYTSDNIVEEAKRFKEQHDIPDMPTDNAFLILVWFENSKQYTAAKRVSDADCKTWPRPTDNAWGGIVNGNVTYARYLVPSTEQVFTEIIQYYDRNGVIRSGVRGSKNTPPLRALTQWEQAMILSTNCSQTVQGTFTNTVPQDPVDMEALKANHCDPSTIIRRRTAKKVASIKTPFGYYKIQIQDALKSNNFNDGDAASPGGTGVSINPSGAFHIVQTLNPAADDVVADFGSGTGRVLVAFATAAKLANISLSVIGVEYAKQLYDISKKLTASYDSISVYNDDLTKIDPEGERYKAITHVFLANPGMPKELLLSVFQTVRRLPNLKQIAFFKFGKENIFKDLANSKCCSTRYSGKNILYGKTGISQLYLSTKEELETFANQQDLQGQEILLCQERTRKNRQLVKSRHIRKNTGTAPVDVHDAIVQYANRMCEQDTTSVDSKMQRMDAIFAARFDPTPLQRANLPDTVNVQLPDGLHIMKSINRSWTGSLPSNCILPYYDRVLREMAIYYQTNQGEKVIYGNRNECLPLTQMDTERVESFRMAAELTGGNNNILQTFYNNYKERNVTQETLEEMIKVFVEQAGIQEVGDMEDSTEIILDQALYKLFNHKILDNALGFGYSTTYSNDPYINLSYKPYSYNSDGCRRPSTSNEDQTNDYVLRLNNSNKSTTIQDLVDTFQAEEQLSDANPPTRRQVRISHHSKYLMLQYKRMQYNQQNEQVDKVRVEADDTIKVNQTTFYFIGALVWKRDHYITYLKSGENNMWQRYDDAKRITPLRRKPRELSKAYVYLYTTKASPTFLNPVPLPNVGNSCWMNGALQLLLAIPELWVPQKSCAQSENSSSEEGRQQSSGEEVPRVNFPTLIDVRGPYVFSSDASELCVFAPAETETSNPRYVRIEGFQQEWLNEPFAKRFLSAITGLGWMQPDFAFDPLRAIWTHPSDPLPHCLGVFDYSEDELQKMQQVTINCQLFPEWLHGMYNNKDAHKQSFCTVMQRLVGLDTTNNVSVDAACIEASVGKYKVFLHLPVPLSVQFGKGLPVAYPAGSRFVNVDTKALVGAREREPIVPRQRLDYPNSCEFQVVNDNNATHQFESSLLRPIVLQNHARERRNVDTFVVSINGTLSKDMTYFLIEKMYEAYGSWGGKIQKVLGAKRVAPATIDTEQVCHRKWESFFKNTNYNEWSKTSLLRLCKNKETQSIFDEYMQPVRLIGSADLQRYSLANGVNLKHFYNDLNTLRVDNQQLQELLNRLKLLIRMNLTTATTRIIHLGKPYYENETERLLRGSELFKLATSKKTWAPNLEDNNWVEFALKLRKGKAMPLSLYSTESDQVKGFTRCAFFQIAILYDLFQKYKSLRTEEEPAFTMIQEWYNAFSAHIDDTQDNVCLQIRMQIRDLPVEHLACQPFRGGAIENLDVLTGPSHPALVWMKHAQITYGNELQQQLKYLMGNFYRKAPLGLPSVQVAPQMNPFENRRQPYQLTQEDLARVEEAQGDAGEETEVLINKFSIPFNRDHARSTAGLNWLTDEVVNFHASLVNDRELQAMDTEKRERQVWVPNSFFITKLSEDDGYNYSNVRRWSKRAKVDIFSLRVMLMPINLGDHWTCAAIDFSKKTITYYDSRGDDGTAIDIYKGKDSQEYNTVNIFDLLRNYLRDEHNDKEDIPWDDAGWENVIPGNTVPQQTNGSDCGFFASQFINYLATNDAFDFTQDDMPRIRQQMLLEILDGQLKAAENLTVEWEKKKIESIVTKKTYRKTLLVDFFCGCGGFTAGMAKSGFFEPLLAVDIQEFKLLMMQSNFPNVVCMRWMLKTGEIDMTNTENNEPEDKEEMLNTIVELGIQRANLGEVARQQWKNGVWPTDFPPLHVHGSPSCQDLSSANQQGKRKKTSETTMGWYTGFIHYLRRRNVPHTMSLEEADIQFDRDSADPNKQALLQVAKFAITDVLGAEERDPLTPFDPTKTYYAHINYERCGVPSTGRRLFCAKGWDPVSIGMRIQNSNALAGGNEDNVDMSTLFEKGNDAQGKPGFTPATKTTMLKTFRIASKAGVGGAKEWVQDFRNNVFTHQEGWANAFHGWFQTREGRKFSWQGTTKYAGKLDANGNPLQWRPKVGNQDDLADLSLSFLQDEGYNQYQPQVKHPPTTIRIRDPSTKPGYRPVVMMPFFWVKMYKEPIAIEATRTNTMGNVYPRWEGQYVPTVPVNMEFIRRISPEEGRVLMSFPGDWVFYCGDECMQKSGDQCAYTMPKGVWCMNQGSAAACCAKPRKKADPRVYSGKPDEDQKCYGDAVPPLISLRIAYEIVQKQGYSLLKGGADALIPYTNDLYAMVLQAEDQTEVMLDALYRFTRSQREHIGNPHFQHFLDPMDDFLTNRYRTNRGNPLGDASRKDYMAALTTISLDDGLLTPQGLRRLEAANRRRRQSSGAMGGTIVNAAYSKIIPFLTSSSTYNAREVAKILFGFPDENLVEDLKQVAEPWKEAAQVLLEKMRDCKQFGFSEAQTPEERRKVYLSQVRRYHPDKQGNKELFQQLVECYKE